MSILFDHVIYTALARIRNLKTFYTMNISRHAWSFMHIHTLDVIMWCCESKWYLVTWTEKVNLTQMIYWQHCVYIIIFMTCMSIIRLTGSENVILFCGCCQLCLIIDLSFRESLVIYPLPTDYLPVWTSLSALSTIYPLISINHCSNDKPWKLE